jgi:hypothetical protein
MTLSATATVGTHATTAARTAGGRLGALAGLAFSFLFLKLRSRLLTAEGGTGELTSLVFASGAVFVALLSVAAAILVVVANVALAGMLAIPAMLVWALATSVAMRRSGR